MIFRPSNLKDLKNSIFIVKLYHSERKFMSMKLYLLHFFREQQTSNYFQTFRVYFILVVNYNFHIDNDYFPYAEGEGISVDYDKKAAGAQ